MTVPRATAALDAGDQIREAVRDLHREPGDFLHLPWRAADDVVGGIPRGDVWFLAGFSGNGKTSWLMNLTDQLLQRGQNVYYMGLESKPQTLRTQLACVRQGLYHGDVLSGKAATWPEWPVRRKELKTEMERQDPNHLVFSGVTHVDQHALRAATHEAAWQSADLIIVDHVDHIRHSGPGGRYDQSCAAVDLLLELAHEYNQRFLVATQCNNEGLRGDPLGNYRPPLPHHVKMGGQKREIASGMLGLYRPFKATTTASLADLRNGVRDAQDFLEPNTMGLVLMKHRLHGNREGRKIRLHFEHGRVTDLP